MSVARIDQANLGFVVLACLVAHAVPVEVLLFSYAIFGPAHYLTELSWLHDRQYFTKRRYDYVPLAVIGFGTIFAYDILKMDLGRAYIGLVLAFFLAITMAFVTDWRHRAPIAAGATAVGLVLFMFTPAVWFFILLANMVHLVLFTSVFILLGALRNNSGFAFATLAALVVFSTTFFIPGLPVVPASDFALSFGYDLAPAYQGFFSLIGVEADNPNIEKMLGFVAFWHIYHNLNWFSKTGIIRWHEISRKRTIFLIAAYLCYIGLYAYDYTLGFRALIFLGFLHVVLEFPLNGLSFANTGRLLVGRLRSA